MHNVGGFIPAELFIVNTHGGKSIVYGHEVHKNIFPGSIIFRDASWGLMYFVNQVSPGTGEIIMYEINFEEWLLELFAAKLKHLYSDYIILHADI